MTEHDPIIRCPSCAGYGWLEDEFTDEAADCDWCDRAGYVYQSADGVQRRIPDSDYAKVADQLEAMEQQRMRELGYSGQALPPWQQRVRRGTKGGQHPDERESS